MMKNNLDDLFEDWEEEFKQEHPIQWWIDEKLFRGASLFGYAPHYALSHPHKFLGDFIDKIKWAWQRAFRGWDDTATWSLDVYLARIIPEVLDAISKQKTVGVSIDYFDNPEDCDGDDAMRAAHERFLSVMKRVADGFRTYYEMCNGNLDSSDLYKKEMEEFNQAMQLFVKYFHTFGD